MINPGELHIRLCKSESCVTAQRDRCCRNDCWLNYIYAHRLFWVMTYDHLVNGHSYVKAAKYWHCPHSNSMRNMVYETVPCPSVRLFVCPSVCLSVPVRTHSSKPAAALLQVCCCGPGRQEILIDCCSSGVWRANAGSTTSSAYVGTWI